MIITSGDAVYKMDYNKVLEYHIAKMADITAVSYTHLDVYKRQTTVFGER